MIPIEDYPVNLLLLRMTKPGVFRSPLEGPPSCFPWHHLFVDKMDTLRRHYGINRYATSSLDAYSYVKMIGKIAHAFACATMGCGGFTPLLPNLILEENDVELNARNLMQFVGGIEELGPREDLLHWIRYEDPTPETLHFVIVQLRLFAMLGSPTYRVVVGRRLTIANPG